MGVPRAVLGLIVAAFLVAACDGGPAGPFPDDAFALVVNRDLGLGNERILVTVSGPDGSRLASPDVDVSLRLSLGDHDPIDLDAEFIWAIPDVSGMYRAVAPLERPGLWFVEVIPAAGDPLEPAPMNVQADTLTPGLGESAPASDTVTLADAPLESITTDPEPDVRFYELSVAEAVTSGRPSVVVFATPRFCTSAVCGPTLELLRRMAPAFPEVNWVHVEVYANLDDPENLELVPAVEEWGLPSEPWVFVVDAAGIVVGRFEGVVSEAEIAALIG